MIKIPKDEFVKLIDEMTDNYSQMFKRVKKLEAKPCILYDDFIDIRVRLEALEK